MSPKEFLGVAETYKAMLGELPEGLRPDFEAEQERIAAMTHEYLAKYNRNIRARIRGYLVLAERLEYAYPWPVVAVLGICQVLGGEWRAQLYGLIGSGLGRLGYRRLDYLADASSDILRRTNRGIFADSVPAVLYALHAHEVRSAGRVELAEALINGPLPPAFDAPTGPFLRELYDGLAIADLGERYRSLRALTIEHFDREQSVFSYHMGVDRDATYARAPGLVGKMTRFRKVPAPQIKDGRLVFRPYELPANFDIRNHGDRVRAFSAAFVESVTETQGDYHIAIEYLHKRFGSGRRSPSVYENATSGTRRQPSARSTDRPRSQH